MTTDPGQFVRALMQHLSLPAPIGFALMQAMDEPTAALSHKEIEELYDLVSQLRDQGKAILFISHKFDEIFRIADRFAVYRDGQFVGDGDIDSIDEDELVRMMVGRSVDQIFPQRHADPGKTILDVSGFCHPTEFEDISFTLRRGEILGFYGLVGAGRSEVMPVFANRWLVWRLPRFTQQYPDIRIQIESDDRNIHPDRLQTDVSIRLRKEPWSGVTAELLLEQKIFPVCSPELASRISTPSHLKSVPIIRGGFLHDAWDRWLQPYEMTDDMLPGGPTFTDPSVCLDAALSGQGVYVASEILACQAIECGHLIELFNDRRSTGYGLWSVVGKASVRKKGVQQFQSWMKEEMSHSIGS